MVRCLRGGIGSACLVLIRHIDVVDSRVPQTRQKGRTDSPSAIRPSQTKPRVRSPTGSGRTEWQGYWWRQWRWLCVIVGPRRQLQFPGSPTPTTTTTSPTDTTYLSSGSSVSPAMAVDYRKERKESIQVSFGKAGSCWSDSVQLDLGCDSRSMQCTNDTTCSEWLEFAAAHHRGTHSHRPGADEVVLFGLSYLTLPCLEIALRFCSPGGLPTGHVAVVIFLTNKINTPFTDV